LQKPLDTNEKGGYIDAIIKVDTEG